VSRRSVTTLRDLPGLQVDPQRHAREPEHDGRDANEEERRAADLEICALHEAVEQRPVVTAPTRVGGGTMLLVVVHGREPSGGLTRAVLGDRVRSSAFYSSRARP
jgi:hypothetical protein